MQEPASPIRAIRIQPAREGEYAEVPAQVPAALGEVLARRGIERLYVHQAEAFEALAAGKNVVVVTPTASGKTLCYNLPVLCRLMAEPEARALYVFPTKALAEDQLHEFHSTVEAMGAPIRAFTYDGDTPQDARKQIRERAGVVLTNPDMLHAGHSAAPHEVGQAVREPALRRDRRAALLSRRLRQPLRQRAAAAEAAVRVSRFAPAVHLLLGDHRQPQGAGREPGGRGVRPGGPQRRALRREVLRVLQSARREPATGHSPRLPERDPAHRLRAGRARAADAGVRQQPAGDGSPGDVPEGRLRAAAGAARRGARLSRRVSAQGAARDRARTARGRHPLRGGDQRAGAGRGHRRAGRRGDGRLSGDDRLLVAARGAGRKAHWARRWRCWWPPARRWISSSSNTRITSSKARPSTRISTRTTSRSC